MSEEKKDFDFYLGSSWFNDAAFKNVEEIKKIGDNLDLTYYSPKDIKICDSIATNEDRQAIFEGNLKAIRASKFMIANTRDKDMGTIFEASYAYAKGIPVIYFNDQATGPFNLMLAQSGIFVARTYEELTTFLMTFKTNPSYGKTYVGEIE